MFKSFKKVLSLVIVMAMLVIVAGCGGASSAAPAAPAAPASSAAPAAPAGPAMPAKPSSPELVQICGATSGGTYFLLANAIAQMLNTSYPDYFKASAQATAGTPANLRLLEAGDSDFAFGQAGVASEALAGKGSFEKALTNFSSVTYVYPNVMQVAVRKGTNIKALADLKGKTFAVGATGS